MTRLSARTAAGSAQLNQLRLGLVVLGAVLISLLLAMPAAAQKRVSNLIADAIELCDLIVTDVDAAELSLDAQGWLIEDVLANGPFVLELSASRLYDDGTDVLIFALIETYPTAQIGYCSFDAQLVPATLDFESVAANYGVDGGVDYLDDAVFGSWESVEDDGVYLLLANQEADFFFLQLTRLSETTAAGPVK